MKILTTPKHSTSTIDNQKTNILLLTKALLAEATEMKSQNTTYRHLEKSHWKRVVNLSSFNFIWHNILTNRYIQITVEQSNKLCNNLQIKPQKQTLKNKIK